MTAGRDGALRLERVPVGAAGGDRAIGWVREIVCCTSAPHEGIQEGA